MTGARVAVVNVRMGSSRLPGKALRSVAGRPLLQCLIERLRRARRIDRIIVATSTLPENDSIAAICAANDIDYFRGSEEDVLGRTVGALMSADAATGVVVFGDGPLIDPALVDRIVDVFMSADPAYDLVGNDLATTYPPGMEVEVFPADVLADADARCNQADVREHGTLYVRQNPERYRLLNVEAPPHLRRPDLELEVDTEEDLEVIEAIVKNFNGRTDFTLEEIIAFLNRRPEIAAINRDVARRWKLFRT
jgi:spore coat polysaccharide biosynthesis protein SpsF